MKTPTLKRRPTIDSALAGLNKAISDLDKVVENAAADFTKHHEAAKVSELAAEAAKAERLKAVQVKRNLASLINPVTTAG